MSRIRSCRSLTMAGSLPCACCRDATRARRCTWGQTDYVRAISHGAFAAAQFQGVGFTIAPVLVDSVVVGKQDIGPAGPFQDSVGCATLTFDAPADPEQRGQSSRRFDGRPVLRWILRRQ